MFCIFPAVFLAAKMSKVIPAETCTNEQRMLKAEPQTAQNIAEDVKQMIIKASQSTSSVEDCKIQTLKDGGKRLEWPLETSEKMNEDETMANEPCKEDSAPSSEKGKCHS